METEIWKDIQGYEGLYQVSSYGRVKSLDMEVRHNFGGPATRKGKILSPRKTIWGYNIVTLCKSKIKNQYSIHRIVISAFNPNPENKKQVNHINGIKTDNRLENLEWCTSSENMKHAIKTKLLVPKSGKESHMYGTIGIKSHVSKSVCQYDLNGNLMKIHESIRQSAIDTKGSSTSISLCCRSKIKTSGGFLWKYKQETL